MTRRINAWGTAIDETVRNAFGRPVVEDVPKNAWGRPVAEPARNAWGRELTEALRRNAWGRVIDERPKAAAKPAQLPKTTTTPTASRPNPQRSVQRPAAAATVVQESSGDPLAPWSADRLASVQPGTRIGVVRRGAGGRWEPAHAFKAG